MNPVSVIRLLELCIRPLHNEHDVWRSGMSVRLAILGCGPPARFEDRNQLPCSGRGSELHSLRFCTVSNSSTFTADGRSHDRDMNVASSAMTPAAASVKMGGQRCPHSSSILKRCAPVRTPAHSTIRRLPDSEACPDPLRQTTIAVSTSSEWRTDLQSACVTCRGELCFMEPCPCNRARDSKFTAL